MNSAQTRKHVCCFYDTEEQQNASASQYLAEGLRARQQCFYAARSSEALERFHGSLQQHGIDADDAVARGALIQKTTAETHLLDGRFDAERMLGLLSDQLEAALNAGFVGLRTCGDMSWLLTDAPGGDAVLIYEALVTQFFRNSRATGMCQYDRRLRPEYLQLAIATHPCVVTRGEYRPNPLDRSAAIVAAHTGTKRTGIRQGLFGESE